ncbi:hypothetical protein OVY01_20800 [Robbsia sp. Bb-Pol-6]|uniref:Uncharacterized protein n=1 Tax=Robbsia betulipollinis TaxID=2981849 RepID=A0ABT3ZSR6_9BURK|nr:hypothetical protein [Robbsia betulipollinis]MCY0389589.1 hypothetical protein [Robbsia betulipollinis]
MSASPLRRFSTEQIETAIADALQKLTGSDVKVSIAHQKYKASSMDALTGKSEVADLSLTVTEIPPDLNINVTFVDPPAKE